MINPITENRIQRLSRICRYNGGTIRHYSVAEHTAHGLDLMEQRGFSKDQQRAFFLHDTPESTLGDIVRPIKNDPRIKTVFDEMENEEFKNVCHEMKLNADVYISLIHARTTKHFDDMMLVVEVETVVDVYVRQRCKGLVEMYDPDNVNHLHVTTRINEFHGDCFRELMGHYERLFT